MTFRESIWRERVVLLVVAGIFLLGNLAFLLGSRSITNSRREALEVRRAALTRDVAAREAEAAKLVGQRERLAQVSSVIDEFYGRRVGSRRATLAPVVEEIHEVMRKAGVSPTSIAYTTAELKELPLSQMLVSFGFQSDYARFKKLVGAFEADRMWIVVREVSLSRNSETTGEVQVRLVLATYFSGEETVPLPPPVAAPGRTTVRSSQRTVRR
jgi:Tfp pilus assembly protein PilO